MNAAGRQSQAEVVSIGRNKVHLTCLSPFSRALLSLPPWTRRNKQECKNAIFARKDDFLSRFQPRPLITHAPYVQGLVFHLEKESCFGKCVTFPSPIICSPGKSTAAAVSASSVHTPRFLDSSFMDYLARNYYFPWVS